MVLQEEQSDAEAQAIAEGLMSSLGVERGDLLEGAYMDLMENSSKVKSHRANVMPLDF